MNKFGKITGVYDQVSPVRGVIAFVIAFILFMASLFIISPSNLSEDIAAWMGESVKYGSNIVADGDYSIKCDNKQIEAVDSDEIDNNCVISTGKDSFINFVSDRGTDVRIADNTELKTDIFEGANIFLSAASKQGSVWVGNNVARDKTSVNVSKILISNNEGSFGVRWNEKSALINTSRGITNVEIFLTEYDANAKRIAAILIPPGYEMEINFSRINENTSKLYYSKLIKEFPLSYISSENISKDKWLLANIEADREQIFYRSNAVRELLKSKSQTMSPFYVNGFMYSFAQGFTFSNEKKEQRTLDRFDYLVANMGNQYILKNQVLAGKYGEDLSMLISDVVANDISGEDVASIKKYSDDVMDVLTVAYIDDDLTKFKSDLEKRTLMLKERESVIPELRGVLAEVFRLIDSSSIRSKESLNRFNDLIKYDLIASSDQVFNLNIVEIKGIRNLLWSLLYRYDELYSVEYFDGLILLNAKLISNYSNKEARNEEIQFVMQSYLRAVSKIIYLIKSGDISIENNTALKLADKLLLQIDDYRKGLTSDVAIINYFEQQSSEFRHEVDYMSSPGFNSLINKGYDEMLYKKSLEEFLRIRDEEKRIQEIVSGDDNNVKVGEIPLNEQVAREKAIDLLLQNGVTYRGLKVNDDNVRIVDIVGGIVEGSEFEASLDVRTHYVFNIKMDDNTVGSGVKIEDLAGVLNRIKVIGKRPESGKLPVDLSGGVKETPSVLEGLLSEIAVVRLRSLGFVIDVNDIVNVDDVEETVSVKSVKWKDDSTDVGFDYNMKKNLFAAVNVDEVSIPGVYNLEELEVIFYDKVEQLNRLEEERLLESKAEEEVRRAEAEKLVELKEKEELAKDAERAKIEEEQRESEIEKIIEDKLRELAI